MSKFPRHSSVQRGGSQSGGKPQESRPVHRTLFCLSESGSASGILPTCSLAASVPYETLQPALESLFPLSTSGPKLDTHKVSKGIRSPSWVPLSTAWGEDKEQRHSGGTVVQGAELHLPADGSFRAPPPVRSEWLRQ